MTRLIKSRAIRSVTFSYQYVFHMLALRYVLMLFIHSVRTQLFNELLTDSVFSSAQTGALADKTSHSLSPFTCVAAATENVVGF